METPDGDIFRLQAYSLPLVSKNVDATVAP